LRRFILLPFIVLSATLLACGLVEGDDEGLFEGTVNVGLTDAAPAGGTYTARNIFPPNVPEVLAIIQVENADSGMEVTGAWYQLATIQQRAGNQTPEGIKVSEAGFTLGADSIDPASNRGGGTLRLRPNAPLPEDSYLLRIYIDGKLAKTAGFVVSRAATTEAPPVTQPPAAAQPPAAQPPAGTAPTPTRTTP
jgi:hypothetical protein